MSREPSSSPGAALPLADLSVLVLAGGAGRRMGGDKPTRELHGARLVDPSLELALRLSDDVLLADGEAALPLPPSARRVRDDPELAGPLAGLLPGLAAARHAWVLVLPCDLLRPSEAVVRALLARARARAAQAVVVRDEAGRQPFHALWARASLPALQARLASGGRSMLSLLDALTVCEVPAVELHDLDPQRGYLCDLDTQDDLRAARRGDLP
ncbi:MAG: molybdenum cofactor guanylyltransferase [Planctomycetota bacterium]|nr:MAG: molybdenum cofactor guanylyltransferase [Planctomycetota bacterium]